ncbi:MAG: transposase [Isosphaeraceae bacterium]
MPEYRRLWRPGGAFFFTVVAANRRPFLAGPLARRCLAESFRIVKARYPWEMPAIVLLPDHLHALWILPRGDSDYSTRWRRIKWEFTRRYLTLGGRESDRSESRRARGERGLWQRRFWEHAIRDDEDYEKHCHYIHANPVRHGFVECARDWPYSSFHRWLALGAYPPDWGCAARREGDLAGLEDIGAE